MFIVLYRWKIKPDKEDQFIKAWSEMSDYYWQNWGSLGSRLHRGNDGLFYAYAQWKSAEERERAFENRLDWDVGTKMTEAIEESFEPVLLEELSDYLFLPKK